VLLIVAAGVWQNQISIFLLLLPVYVFVIGLLAVGLGWIVSSLHVFLRDTAQVLSVILTLWFWVTPVMIFETQFPSWSRWMLALNPLYYIVRSYRALLLTQEAPSLADLGIAAAYGAAAFLIGGLFFRYMKKGFADVL
jgi:lipopolysaccharide transport system permease protein